MVPLKADWLLYYFLDQKRIFIIPAKALWLWFFGNETDTGAVNKYPLVAQGKAEQLNVTCGHKTPIDDVYRYVKFIEYRKFAEWELQRDFEGDHRKTSLFEYA